ncbi:hypothetical protein A2954_02905 [Candidatus Roizmanbacteria bacterium RIFCSPLOWO2_01_FULL_37_12]|uniref:tRNA dimethylallyltransferase n=1 Tax=Candidatus Roizmanbacteria bacterium RIFCSPLOWO2_01_FULL_37_12 TaxID=1802056 RepID=A0A1F7IAE1_9BACT|nr:MAG: hypothetical protein A3D76_04435 [Candidatus Roizmanbacteria bacterium RIFCSPHIGHO2_02_FULL_37_9b]OGK40326.1 MAG: hypothetical protein A2954_02905 [Candidatus Roizmanbacteria bacterium RIFCSPLOWO2_01_FULL_37_12]
MQDIIVITGQTATGKTSLALKLAQKHGGEIVNCDSRQIYKYMNVITGKDVGKTKFIEESKLNNFSIGFFPVLTKFNNFSARFLPVFTNLWLYDIVKPDRYFSSFDFKQCALYVINSLKSRGKTPIIIGGSYFYLKHLLYGVDTENIPPDWKLRIKLKDKSVDELQKILAKHSTQLISQLSQSERNNPQRLIRKIEILQSRAKRRYVQPLGLEIQTQGSKTNEKLLLTKKLSLENMQIKFFGLKFKNKDLLQRSVEKRVEERLKHGAVAEVKKLLKMGYSETDPGLKTIGYQQLMMYLKGAIDFDTAIQLWINKEVQYAKRQYTFMKTDKNIKWRKV